jgi:hypothetical protein
MIAECVPEPRLRTWGQLALSQLVVALLASSGLPAQPVASGKADALPVHSWRQTADVGIGFTFHSKRIPGTASDLLAVGLTPAPNFPELEPSNAALGGSNWHG